MIGKAYLRISNLVGIVLSKKAKKPIESSPLEKKAEHLERRDHINLEAEWKKEGKLERKGKNK